MRSTLTVLVRLTVFLALALVLFAAGIARFVPRKRPNRRPAAAALAPLKIPMGSTDARDGLLGLDPESGRIVRRDTSPREYFDLMVGSPWRDSDSKMQAVGRWQRLAETPEGLTNAELGLGRVTFPHGEVINRVVTRVALAGPPCWKPSTLARVIYPATDGRLYQFDFDTADILGIDPTPQPIEWGIPTPGAARIILGDPVWPTDPRFHGRLLVSLLEQKRRVGDIEYPPPQFWWLQLDASGHTIINAAPITQADQDQVKCRPVIFTRPDGTLRMAYISRSTLQGRWRLKCVALIEDPKTGLPAADVTRTEILATDCLQSGLAVSKDGRWLTYLQLDAKKSMRPRRIDLNAYFDESRRTPTAAVSEVSDEFRESPPAVAHDHRRIDTALLRDD